MATALENEIAAAERGIAQAEAEGREADARRHRRSLVRALLAARLPACAGAREILGVLTPVDDWLRRNEISDELLDDLAAQLK